MITASFTFSPTVAPANVIAVARGKEAVPAGAIAHARFAKDAMLQLLPLFFMPARACALAICGHGGFEPGSCVAVGLLCQLKLRPVLAQQ
jgi:hypothetical protein